jgi:hypothetical protein
MSAAVDDQQRLRQKLPAGIIDASLSSLATFAAGLAAVRWLTPAELGIYSVIFSAFLVGSLLPAEITYTPVQVSMIKLEVQERLGGFVHSLGRGIPPALLGCVVILVAGAVIWWRSDPTADLELALTGVALTVISPMQDHLRRGFHIAERSWDATWMSAAQLVAVAGTLFAMQSLGVDPAWAPLGSLAIANGISLAFGLALSRASWRVRPEAPVVTVSGRWLAASSITAYGGTLVASVVMTLVAGPEIVGFAEAARVASQPVLVVTTGVAAAFASRHLRAADSVDRAAALTVNKSFFMVVAVAGISYLFLAGFAWSFNPLFVLMPSAYQIAFLIPVTILSNLVLSVTSPLRDQLIAANREVPMAKIDFTSLVIPTVVATSAGVTGAFARPLGIIGQNIYRTVRYRAIWRSVFPPGSDEFQEERERETGGEPLPGERHLLELGRLEQADDAPS